MILFSPNRPARDTSTRTAALLRLLGAVLGFSLLAAACSDEPEPVADGAPIAFSDDDSASHTQDNLETREVPVEQGEPGESTDDPTETEEVLEPAAPGSEATDDESSSGPTTAPTNTEPRVTTDPLADPPPVTPPGNPELTSPSSLLGIAALPPQLVVDPTSYSSLAGLLEQQETNDSPNVCGAAQTTTDLLAADNGDAAGQIYNHADGRRSVASQVWVFSSAAAAESAMDLADATACTDEPSGRFTVDGATYDVNDTVYQNRETVPIPKADASDRLVWYEVEHKLDGPFTFFIVENTVYERSGNTIVQTTHRELSESGNDWPTLDASASVVHRSVINNVLDASGYDRQNAAASFTSPSSKVVGVDIVPGVYRSTASDFCIVSRVGATNVDQDDSLTELIEQLTWDEGEQAVVSLVNGEGVVETNPDCGTWERLDGSSTSTLGPDGSGTLIVGFDIEPGTITVTSVGECIVRRLAGLSGSARDLIEEQLPLPGTSFDLTIEANNEVAVYLSSDCRR